VVVVVGGCGPASNSARAEHVGEIAYLSWDGEAHAIHVVRTDGTTEVLATATDGGLDWSPDGTRLAFVRCDPETEVRLDDCKIIVLEDDVERDLGPIDLLVNNAAVATPVGPAWEVESSAWWRTIEVNLRGPFLCVRAVLPSMVRRRAGRIVNIVAVAAFNTAPFMSAYGGSKAALVSFTDDLAAEVREHGIAVFAIRPGLVQTRMQDELTAAPYLQRRRGGQAPALVPAERAAEAVVFVATGRADALSGRFIDVTRDDVAELVSRADEIVGSDLLAMRLRT
jgi:NAD(P)-dependent dehydrogenase (short-subunit alcohol dehydrogenase family)